MTSPIFEFLHNFPHFKWIGAIVVFVKLFKVIHVMRTIYKRNIGAKYQWPNLGKWAVVTGGTDGIGKAYAEELAKKGFNICIISRNVEKLDAVAKEIELNHKVATKSINVDFTGGKEIYEIIKIHLDEIGEIGVLVNNVGMSYKYAEYFHAIPNGLKVMSDLIYSNITSCTMMMKLILPDMLERKNGVIINIASLIGIYPMPLLATYAASKAYVDYLSKATQYEYKDKGIIIQSVLPGYVATKMSNRRARFEVPSAQQFVSSSIETVGLEDITYGYLPHKIRGFVHEWLKANMPARINLAIAMYFMSKNRESYLRKLQKKVRKF